MVAQTAFGPQGPNYSTTRPPADPKASGGTDTWFKNCSSAGAKDGTFATADFFNVMLGNIRYLVRTAGVTLDDATDTMVYNAVEQLIANASVNYAVDQGGVNAINITLGASITAYTPGLNVYVKIAATNSGPTTINVNGIGVVPVKRPDQSDLRQSDIVKNEVAHFIYDGTQFQKMALSNLSLTQQRTYYVDAVNGNDSNDGLAAGTGRAFASIQRAINVSQFYNLNGFNVNIIVADYLAGTYAPIFLNPINGSGSVTITGNVGTPANTTIASTSGPAITGEAGQGYLVTGFKVTSSATDVVAGRPGAGVWAKPGCTVGVSNLEFGTCADGHMYATGGTIAFGGTMRVTGGTTSHLLSVLGGFIYSTGNPLTVLNIVNAVAFSGAFAATAGGDSIIVATYSSILNAANASGPRYSSTVNGVINTNGGGASYLPGSSAGSTATGGQYV